VFDRFDYAKLLAERDGILDYVTYLLMDSHVIYVGFGLDDPTFNLMETRLQTLHGVYRPQSFAFIPTATELERAAWRNRKLDIIDYGDDHDNLHKILESENKILNFIGWAEPLRRSLIDIDPKKDRTKKYMAEALDHYVRGKFNESLSAARAALASTLFWERQPLDNPQGVTILPFDEAARLCSIRIRMALNHYKLLWTPYRDDAHRNHKEGLEENEKAARSIIKEQREYLGKPTDYQKSVLVALENSLNILQARIHYRNSRFVDARNIYKQVVNSGELEIPEKKARENFSSLNEGGAEPPRPSDETIEKIRNSVLRKLRFAEGHFYADCQISRIVYQFRGEDSEVGLNDRVGQMEFLDGLVSKIKEYCKFIEDSEQECKEVPEWDYYRNSFGILHRIAIWTAGRHAVGVCRDVIPTKEERCQEIWDKLSDGIRRLEEDPVGTEEIKWEMSQRWFALRYRYLCRAYTLRWVVGQDITDQNASSDADLVDAYKAIQKALQVAGGPGLERERMVNLLEAARLNVLAMFGERIGSRKGRDTIISPLSFGAGLYYLDAAFREIAEEKERRDVKWLEILSYRIASYFAIVSGKRKSIEIERVRDNGTLFQFLSNSVEEMRDIVANGYSLFAEKQGKAGVLDQRIESYQQCLGAIREEMD
jgi:hypothetical protein